MERKKKMSFLNMDKLVFVVFLSKDDGLLVASRLRRMAKRRRKGALNLKKRGAIFQAVNKK